MSSAQDMQSVNLASFDAIRTYDWATDHEFQVGLQSILSSASSPDQAATLAQRAKCFFYSKKSGIRIDYDAFNTWLAQQEPAASEPNPVARSHQRNKSASILGRPSIDATNPVVNSENFPIDAPSEETSVDSALSTPVPNKVDVSYPTSFAHIVELIATGQPIPGIREIPNVLNTAPPSEATKPKRRKPWEIAADSSSESVQGDGVASSTVGVGP